MFKSQVCQRCSALKKFCHIRKQLYLLMICQIDLVFFSANSPSRKTLSIFTLDSSILSQFVKQTTEPISLYLFHKQIFFCRSFPVLDPITNHVKNRHRRRRRRRCQTSCIRLFLFQPWFHFPVLAAWIGFKQLDGTKAAADDETFFDQPVATSDGDAGVSSLRLSYAICCETSG